MKRSLLLLTVIMVSFTMCKKKKESSVAALTTTNITDATSTSVKTGGTITDDGGSAITKKGVCWATHAAPTVADSITNDGTGSASFTSTITGLSAYTTYYVRAYAINASGTAYGNEISFKTSTGLPTLTTNAVTDIVALSAKSGGNITNDGGSPVTARGVVFGTSPNPTVNNSKTSDSTGTGQYTSTMSPLASQATYYVRAYATNSFGTAYGNQVQFIAASANTITDVDGNVYQYITVCGKQWMASNLKTAHYRNGDSIVNGYAATNYNWYTDTRGAYTFPNGDPANNATYGKLYNVQAVEDSRGVCPAGWHVPTDDEWKAIEMCQGMSQADADNTGLRGTVGANFLEGGSTGLNLQKAGYLYPQPSSAGYLKFGQFGVFMSSTVFNAGFTNWYRAFNVSGAGPIYRQNSNYAASVRCVKD